MRDIEPIIRAIADAGGTAYRVGGCVRDQILGIANKDLDIEVYHLDASTLAKLLSRFGHVNEVGASFGVIKLSLPHSGEVDFTLPRRESKVGRGHRGFQVELDHSMTVFEAALRRDFTINAIYQNAHNLELIDPHGGIDDLQAKRLKATSEHFVEDPLRVLRGMQFAARFDATLTQETVVMCRTLLPEYPTLAKERIWTEWFKWATKGALPSKGLMALHDCGWLPCYPEIANLQGVQQDPQWHPEGDVWTHTLHVCDAAAKVADREQLDDFERSILLFAALCHDIGKPCCTTFEDGRWKSPGHAQEGVPLASSFLNRIGCPIAISEVVLPLVAEHMVHYEAPVSMRTARRLSVRLDKASLVQLGRLVESDLSGRPPLPQQQSEAMQQMLELAQGMKIEHSKPAQIIQGRNLIELGYAPAPWFRNVLDKCYEAQLDGVFDDQASGLECLRRILLEKNPTTDSAAEGLVE
jgi:tRNA nucleotidyltransferase (CCA-adding enzyme)